MKLSNLKKVERKKNFQINLQEELANEQNTTKATMCYFSSKRKLYKIKVI